MRLRRRRRHQQERAAPLRGRALDRLDADRGKPELSWRDVLRGPVALKHPYLPDSVKIVTYNDAPPDVMQAAAGLLEQVRGETALSGVHETAAAPPLSSPQTERRFCFGWREAHAALADRAAGLSGGHPVRDDHLDEPEDGAPGRAGIPQPSRSRSRNYARALRQRLVLAHQREHAGVRAAPRRSSPSSSAPSSPGWSSAPTRRSPASSASC